MGYLVETSGRILLPQELERQALTVLEVRMGARGGWFDADQAHVDSLEEIAPYAAAQVRRDGDWLLVGTDTDGDPKWSEQASEFYRSLGSFVHDGEVHLRGEDGQAWSYVYSRDGVVQRGANGWDGTPGEAPETVPVATPPPPSEAAVEAPLDSPDKAPEEPGTPQPSQFHYPGSDERPQPPAAPTPYAAAPQPPVDPGPPDYRAERAWADPPPASTGRTLLMAALLVIGVVLIIGLALLVSGL